jgi:uncharacterized protein YjbI with pentapeptide repeats
VSGGPRPAGPDGTGASLRADCQNCFGLCCVALPFTASADFAITKAAGHACPNLRTDFRCGIHGDLRSRGFPGCTVYDCFGAGQKVSQETFGGHDWRGDRQTAEQMFAVFPVMRQLHELLWYLTEALALQQARVLQDELTRALDETERLTHLDPESLSRLDVAAHRGGVNVLLRSASELARAAGPRPAKDRSGADLIGADLIGADLGGADLRGASLRGAYLIGANLAGADLRGADLIGVDFRGADLSGADLTGSLFLTQSQVNAANGDDVTTLPSTLVRPAHWPRSSPRPPTRSPGR